MTLNLSSTTLQALSTLRTRIDQRLEDHPSLERIGLANLDQALTDAEAASIELTIRSTLHDYWELLEKPAMTRRQCHIEDIEVTLRQLLDVQIAAGRIHPIYATCLPASLDQNDLTISTLSLKLEASRTATLLSLIHI